MELLPLPESDFDYILKLLVEFHEKTESIIAKTLIDTWSEASKKFVKVFPYEYQRALKALAEEKATENLVNGTPVNETKPEPKIADIEDAVTDHDAEKKRLEKILDKTR